MLAYWFDTIKGAAERFFVVPVTDEQVRQLECSQATVREVVMQRRVMVVDVAHFTGALTVHGSVQSRFIPADQWPDEDSFLPRVQKRVSEAT